MIPSTRPARFAFVLPGLCAIATLAVGCSETRSTGDTPESADSAAGALAQSADTTERQRVEDGSTWSIDHGTLIFSGKRGEETGLYLLRPEGVIEPLTDTPVPASNYARWSPDGSRILFQARVDGTGDIFVADADGKNAVNLTRHPAWEVLPVWSPDGSRIAFMSTRGFELGSIGPFPGHIYVADANGENLRTVTRTPLTSSLGPSDWSPDGRRLIFARTIDGQLELFQIDVDTGAETRWSSSPVNEYGAAFSPDGTRVAFHSETEAMSQITVMDLVTGARRDLTSGPGFRYGPRWSPDGTWISFTSQGAGGRQYDVIAIRIADGLERTLIATPEDEREGSWRP